VNRFLNGQTVFAFVMSLLFVAVAGFANNAAESKVAQVATHNVSATSLLARIQIQAEKMRRYEKEMFIYAATPDKRAKYVKEFTDANVKLLDLQNEAAGPSHKGFSDAERVEVLKWKEATAFYTSEFTKVTNKAESSAADPALTITLNTDIGPGKDKFREVLDGASKMRESKEKESQAVGAQIHSGFDNALWAVIGMAMLMVLASVFVFAPKAAPQRADARMSQLRSGLPTQGRV
jgi:hypothetical protein